MLFSKRETRKEMPSFLKSLLLAFAVLSLVLVLLFKNSFFAFAESKYLDFQSLVKVLNLIQRFYVDQVDTKKLIQGSIKGMLAELDPHTNFLPPSLYKEFKKDAKGEFGGLGIEITLKGDFPTVISSVEDTPAWKAGVKSGDQIISVDGRSTKNLTLAEVAQMMRGKRGIRVQLEIIRKKLNHPKKFTITRGLVKIQSIKYIDFGGGDAYIRITSFVENSHKQLKAQIKRHQSKYKKVSGLILDIRRNPGGLFEQSIKISDLFLKKGVIVKVIGRNQKKKEIFYAQSAEGYESFPLIILIDEYSASASEILAGALQDHGRALIMGRRSFGKGSVQSLVDLGDKSGLKMTVARYYTPKGRSIQAEGILPDIETPEFDMALLTEAKIQKKIKREENIVGHLPSKEGAFKKAEKKKKHSLGLRREKLLSSDFQLLQAYNHLKALKKLKKENKEDRSLSQIFPTDFQF